MSSVIIEHRFTCPYCWERITMLLELTSSEQSYVEDCEVCCHPIHLQFSAEGTELREFDARRIE